MPSELRRIGERAEGRRSWSCSARTGADVSLTSLTATSGPEMVLLVDPMEGEWDTGSEVMAIATGDVDKLESPDALSVVLLVTRLAAGIGGGTGMGGQRVGVDDVATDDMGADVGTEETIIAGRFSHESRIRVALEHTGGRT